MVNFPDLLRNCQRRKLLTNLSVAEDVRTNHKTALSLHAAFSDYRNAAPISRSEDEKIFI